MPALLELPEVRQRLPRWSVRRYEQFIALGAFPKGVELLRGLVVEKMAKSPLHFTLTQRLAGWLRERAPAGFTVRQEGPLVMADDSLPEPDVAVVRGQESDFLTCHPTAAELVVEVAVSSATLDRANASLYAEAGVPEYWIVLAPTHQVEVHRRPAGGVYQETFLYPVGGAPLVCGHLPSLSTPAGDWFL